MTDSAVPSASKRLTLVSGLRREPVTTPGAGQVNAVDQADTTGTREGIQYSQLGDGPNRHSVLANPEAFVVIESYEKEVLLARAALQWHNFNTCFRHLERAHVLAQRATIRHTYVHWLMLVAGLHRRDYREVIGQIPRIFSSLLFSRLWVPIGNTGRARVNALRTMPVPEDLRHLFSSSNNGLSGRAR